MVKILALLAVVGCAAPVTPAGPELVSLGTYGVPDACVVRSVSPLVRFRCAAGAELTDTCPGGAQAALLASDRLSLEDAYALLDLTCSPR